MVSLVCLSCFRGGKKNNYLEELREIVKDDGELGKLGGIFGISHSGCLTEKIR